MNPLYAPWFRCAARALLALGLAVPSAAQGAAQSPRQAPPKGLPWQSAAVQIDGDLTDGEWSAAWKMELAAGDRVAHSRGGAWRGPEDLSATFWLSYDAAHLYVAGSVRDDQLVRQRKSSYWHQGDAVELFLDVDPDNDAGEEAGHRFNADDLQIFLMPLNPSRPWGLVAWSGAVGEAPHYGGAALTGVRVAALERQGRGYDFEAAIPFHSLPGFEPGTERVAFNLAVDDCDDPDRYNYITWTGTNPVDDVRQLRLLRFAGAPPLTAAGQSRPSWWSTWTVVFLRAAWALLAVVVAVVVLWVGRRAVRGRPALGRWCRVAGGLLLLLGLLLPAALTHGRELSRQTELRLVTERVRAALPAMEQGTLGSYRGGERDAPLLRLLSGESVPRKQVVTHVPLADLVGAGELLPVRHYPVDGFPVRPYWLPLSGDELERIAFREPLGGPVLNVVLWAPAFGVDNSAAALRCVLQYAGQEDPVVEELPISRPWIPAFALGHPERDMTTVRLELSAPLQSLGLTPLRADGVGLVGLSTASASDAVGRAIDLGQASLGGVETGLRGPYPEDAGVLLAPGQERVLSIARDRAQSFERLFLFYRADFPGADKPLPLVGERVCEVELHFAGDSVPPKVIAFTHQESMFFELAAHNIDPEPSAAAASVALRWEDQDQEQRITLGYEVELDSTAVVREIRLRSTTASYPIRFRSATFRASKPQVRVEPPDSPLEITADNRSVAMARGRLEQMRGAEFAIYRGGVLQETTVARVPMNLPRGLERRLAATPFELRPVDTGPERAYEAYFPLVGEGWSDAVLAAFLDDPGHTEYRRWVHRLGAVLCLLSAPLLLLLFGDLLGVLGSLRARLIAVLIVSTVVPLVVLSLVLVSVLESGHDEQRQGTMQQAMSAATRQLQDEQNELLDSARQWIEPLAAEVAGAPVGEDGAVDWDALHDALVAIMDSQKPPEWDGGFLRFELVSAEDGVGVHAYVGDPALRAAETPLRRVPGFYVTWGIPLLGVRWEVEAAGGGRCSLSVARPLDQGLLGGLAPGRGIVLCDTRGYPLAVADADLGRRQLEHTAVQPAMMEARREALAVALDHGQSTVTRHETDTAPWVAVYDVLRDLEETPRALLGVVDVDRQAELPLRLGPVPVREYFAAVGCLLLALSVLLASVITARLTKPLERLERGAQALRRGDFGVRVRSDERGQLGRLTRTFNLMADDLQDRMQELRHLNRGIQDVTERLDPAEIVTRAIGFCAQHSDADRVCAVLRESDRGTVRGYGAVDGELDREDPDLVPVLAAVGPCSVVLDRDAPHALWAGAGSLLVLPLVLAARRRGALVLVFDAHTPPPVHLELLTTIAAQAAVALENARLYRHAVEDLDTGAFVADYFRRRIAEQVSSARESGGSVALVGVALSEGGRLAESLGARRFSRLLEHVASVLRRALPAGALLGRAADAEFWAGLPDTGAAEAERCRARIGEELERLAASGFEGSGRLRFDTAAAAFPETAASAEFLFDAMRSPVLPSDEEAAPRAVAELESHGVVFRSPAMQAVLRTLQRVAPTDLTVLLEGETGTGKEVLTELIHRMSRRAAGPLVKVHCAALSESLLQSELFGHEKGAFTGATAAKVGKFELADGGTVFLDEIGEISLQTQVKLLRVLQEREIDRVGGLEPVPVDVRVIAATNRDMRRLVAEGRFREDLYYRLQGMVITVPPLRARKQEIPDLVARFHAEGVRAGYTSAAEFHPDALDELFQHDWPGNVRELRNTVLRAMVLATGPQVRREDLLGVLDGEAPAASPEARRVDARRSADPAPSPLGATAAGSSVKGTPVKGSRSLRPPGRQDLAEPRTGAGSEEPAEPAAPTPGPGIEGRRAMALEWVRSRGELTSAEYMQLSGVSARTAVRDLAGLVARGDLERVGRRRGARYRLRAQRGA